jgi:hypothetical protein
VDEQRLREMLDRDAIEAVLTRYLEAVRRRDWPEVLSCFVPGAYADYGFDVERTIEAQAPLLERGMQRFDVSTFLGSTCVIELAGDRASSSMSAFTAHQASPKTGDRTRVSTVRYEDEWIGGEDGTWRITSRKLHTVWRAWLDPRFDDRAGDHRYAEEW